MAENFWDGAKRALSLVAPTLASAVGGPLAGAATSAIIGALGLAPAATQEQAAAAVVGATPDQLLALKKADQDFAEKMGQLNLDTEKLAFDDLANARARETVVKDRTPAIMGFIILAGALAAAGAVLAGYVSETSLQAGVVIGYLFSEAKQVLGYYFGTTADGDAKTAMIYNSTPAGVK
jgi:ABC-type Fe3+-siderophore transport system permease subunit